MTKSDLKEIFKSFGRKATDTATRCFHTTVDSTKTLLDFIIKHPFSVYILLFLKPIVDMFYNVAVFDYFTLLYAGMVFGYLIYKRPNIIKNLKLIDYLTLLIVLMMFFAFLRNTSGLRVFIKTVSQFLLFFIGRYSSENTKTMLNVLKVASLIVIVANAIGFFAGMLSDSAATVFFAGWGDAITFKGFYYFKTDLAMAITLAIIFVIIATKMNWFDYIAVSLGVFMIFMSNARISFAIIFIILGLAILFKNEKRFKKKLNLFDWRVISVIIISGIMAITVLLALSKLQIAQKFNFIGLDIEISQPVTPPADTPVSTPDAPAPDSSVSSDTNKFDIKEFIGRFYNGANTQGRSVIWSMLFDDFNSRSVHSRIFGIDFVSDQYYYYDTQPDVKADAHNAYLKTMYSIGLLGLLIFFFFMLLIIIRTYKTKNRPAFYAVMLLLCMLLIASFTNNTNEYTMLTWLPMFFVGVLFRRGDLDEKGNKLKDKEEFDYTEEPDVSNTHGAEVTRTVISERERAEHFFESNKFDIIITLLSIIAIFYQFVVTDAISVMTLFILVVLLITTCIILLVCKNIMTTTLPFLLICTVACALGQPWSGTAADDTFNAVIDFWWLAIPIVLSLVYHFVVYRKPIKLGATFRGTAAVAVACTLGGLFYISPARYFSPGALYYTLGLGIGMVISYILIKSQVADYAPKALCDRLLTILYFMGIAACAGILFQYIPNWDTFVETKSVLIHLVSRNEFPLFIMMTLPAPMYFALKNPCHLLSVAFFYICAMLSGSRGGLIFCTMEIFLVLIYLVIFANGKKKYVYIGITVAVTALFIIFGSKVFTELYSSRLQQGELVNPKDTRMMFLHALKENFLSNPIFGQGLGAPPDPSIYNPKVGAMYWYHMFFPQIIGSMGIVGILCYGFQLVNRFYTVITRVSAHTWALALSYVGIFMMSQVNPGEFCPLPHELLVVIVFIALESCAQNVRFVRKKTKDGLITE